MYTIAIDWFEFDEKANEELLSYGVVNIEIINEKRIQLFFEFFDVMLSFLVEYYAGDAEKALNVAATRSKLY